MNEHLDPGAAYRNRRFYRAVELASAAVLGGDHFPTVNGDLVIHPVDHASLVLGWNGRTIYFNNLSAGLSAVTTVPGNGASRDLLDLTVEAIPAYNSPQATIPRAWATATSSPSGASGSTSAATTADIAEMRALRDIDVALVCMTVPFTMTVAKAASAVREFRPKLVYLNRYRNQDGSYAVLDAFKRHVGTDLGIEVRKRAWY